MQGSQTLGVDCSQQVRSVERGKAKKGQSSVMWMACRNESLHSLSLRTRWLPESLEWKKVLSITTGHWGEEIPFGSLEIPQKAGQKEFATVCLVISSCCPRPPSQRLFADTSSQFDLGRCKEKTPLCSVYSQNTLHAPGYQTRVGFPHTKQFSSSLTPAACPTM